MKLKLTLLLLLTCLLHNAQAQIASSKKEKIKQLKNFYALNDSVYRAAQPSKKDFKTLEAAGFKTILNLRRKKDDQRKAKGTQLQLEHLRFKTKALTQADIIAALQIIKDAKKPILIHCWHGSDRTGVVSAAYRIVFQNWSKEDAIAEMRNPSFGYHENWYPNLLDLLRNLDVVYIKKSIQL